MWREEAASPSVGKRDMGSRRFSSDLRESFDERAEMG